MAKTNGQNERAQAACAREWAKECDQITGGFRVFISRRREPNENPAPPESPGKFEGLSLRE